MSSATDRHGDSQTPELLHPQVRRLNRSNVLGDQQSEDKLASKGYNQTRENQIPSGTSTPIPPDAPPSVQATSSARKALRAQNRRRIFPTVDYEARVSHFDPRSNYHDFRGFFVLFWIGLAIMVMTTMLRNFKETGSPFLFRQRKLFLENIWSLAVSDLVMSGSIMVSYPLHTVFYGSTGILQWDKAGVWIQSVYQLSWLAFWTAWPFILEWTWTAQVFFTLHMFVLFMKMHSYSFYNGHLSKTRLRLSKLDTDMSSSREAAVKYPVPGGHRLHEIKQDFDSASPERPERALQNLREDLAVELTSPFGNVTYPDNLTIGNFFDYLFCPTLCYELEYPRTEERQLLELFYKTLAVFGCIFLLTIVSEEFIMPVLDESADRLSGRQSLGEGSLIFAETVSRLLFPFMIIFLLVFLVIFEYLLGAFAEITRFADRNFYDDWWNSSDWLEFSREWNIPVHNFLRRHVYAAMSRPINLYLPMPLSPTISKKNPFDETTTDGAGDRNREEAQRRKQSEKGLVSRPVATVIAFFISALAHEVVMASITKKIRGYGFFAMMLQMPIVMVQRSRLIKGRTLLNNILFWCSMILGLSMMCALYVLL